MRALAYKRFEGRVPGLGALLTLILFRRSD